MHVLIWVAPEIDPGTRIWVLGGSGNTSSLLVMSLETWLYCQEAIQFVNDPSYLQNIFQGNYEL